MANELELTATLKYNKGGVTEEVSVSSKLDVNGDLVTQTVQDIGTAVEVIDLASMTSPGVIIVENLDATNYVEMRRTTSDDHIIKIRPKSFAGPLELADTTGAAPALQANTAACKVRITIIEK